MDRDRIKGSAKQVKGAVKEAAGKALGDAGAADDAYRMAIGLEADPAVRRFLQERRAGLSSAPAVTR